MFHTNGGTQDYKPNQIFEHGMRISAPFGTVERWVSKPNPIFKQRDLSVPLGQRNGGVTVPYKVVITVFVFKIKISGRFHAWVDEIKGNHREIVCPYPTATSLQGDNQRIAIQNKIYT